MNVLVVNAGSSSLKYQLIETESGLVSAKGVCERIGGSGSSITHKQLIKDIKTTKEAPMKDHSDAMKLVVEVLTDKEIGCISDMNEIQAIGHRVVHGGAYFSGSILMTDEVLEKIELCKAFAPLHTVAHLMGIKGCLATMPGKPQVLVFDTAFHQTMPEVAYTYAIPREYYEKDKVRRYGFHGTSHKYVAGRAAAMLGKPAEELKLISCHLGNGSSVTAIDGGKSVDTSMGFTPIAGVPMGTRCGDIDAGIMEYLMKKYNMGIAEMMSVLNKKSGVAGISCVSSDFRDLEDAQAEGNRLADLALKNFRYNVKKFIGAYAAAMGGVDAIIFTAGVGENGPVDRMEICDTLGYLGVKIDPVKNGKRGEEMDVSAEGATTPVLVIPTNEELMIAKDTAAIVG